MLIAQGSITIVVFQPPHDVLDVGGDGVGVLALLHGAEDLDGVVVGEEEGARLGVHRVVVQDGSLRKKMH